MLSRGADTFVRFHSKTAKHWAMENGDGTLATLVERAELFTVLTSPRTVARLTNAKGGIHLLPKELLMRIAATLFPPLLELNHSRHGIQS